METGAPELEIQKEEFYKKTLAEIKGTLNPEIVKNPAFEENFHKECNYLLYKTGDIKFDVVVAPDKNSVSITSYSPLIDCKKEFAGKNKAFIRSTFELKDGNLLCEYNQGALFDRNDIEKDGVKIDFKYESKLETTYSARFFDADGIQLSDNSYTDTYPFQDKASDVDLRERTMSTFHKPEFRIKGFPKIPIHVIKATVRNTYRKYDSLGIIHSNMGTATKDGYCDLVCGLYTCHTGRPELLRGFNKFAEAKGDTNNELKFEVIDNYAPDLTAAYNKAVQEFKDGLKDSNLEEFSKRTYEAILKNV